jgi:hypothetical protein
LSIFLGAGCSKEEPKTQTQKENKQVAETVETVESAEKTRAILKSGTMGHPMFTRLPPKKLRKKWLYLNTSTAKYPTNTSKTACFRPKKPPKLDSESVNKPKSPASHHCAALSRCIRGGRHYRQVG